MTAEICKPYKTNETINHPLRPANTCQAEVVNPPDPSKKWITEGNDKATHYKEKLNADDARTTPFAKPKIRPGAASTAAQQ